MHNKTGRQRVTMGGLLGNLYIVYIWPRAVVYVAMYVATCPLYGDRTHFRLQTTVITTQPPKAMEGLHPNSRSKPVTNPLYSFKCVFTTPHLEHRQ